MSGHPRLLFFLVILLNCHAAFAQKLTQSIRGRIIDKDTKVTLPGANVILLNSEPLNGCVSDVNGYFRLEKVPLGRQSLKISFLGYEDAFVREIEITSAKEVYLTVELRESYIQSKEVVITAAPVKQATTNDMSLVSSRSFTVEETSRYAASWGDPSRMAANFAGVSIVSDKRNDIIVRGNSPMNVLWKLDGVDIPNPNHFAVAGSSGGAISMINNNLLDNSDFHTGAFAAEYANALSAVFDLKFRNGNNEKREYLFQAGVNGFEGGAEGPFVKGKKASYLLNYRYSTLTLLDKAGISIIEAIPNFQDLSYKCHFPLKKGFISFFGIAGSSMADYKPEKTTDFLSDTRNRWGYVSGTKMGIAALSFQHLLSNKTYMKINLSASAYNPFDGSDSTGTDFKVYDKYYSEFVEYKLSFNTLFNTKINARNMLRWGGAVQHTNITNNSFTYAYMPDPEKTTVSDMDGELVLSNLHFQWMHNLNKYLSFTAGINSMYLALNGKTTVEPRLAVKWDFMSGQTLTAGFGMHNQTQPYAVYFLESTDTTGNIISPNKKLDFSESMHGVLGYHLQLTDNMRLKLETYYQKISHIPVSGHNPYFSLMNFATDDNIFNYASLKSEGEGYNYGLETTLEKFLFEGSYFLLTATLFDSKYLDAFNTERNTRFNTNYLFTGLAGKDFKFSMQKNSVFGLHVRFTYIGGQRYTPINLDASRLAGHAVYIDSLAFSSQYPPFTKLDVRLRYRLNLKAMSGELALDVTNVLNRKNVEYQQYDAYLQDVRYVYNLSRIPVVFLKIEF